MTLMETTFVGQVVFGLHDHTALDQVGIDGKVAAQLVPGHGLIQVLRPGVV